MNEPVVPYFPFYPLFYPRSLLPWPALLREVAERSHPSNFYNWLTNEQKAAFFKLLRSDYRNDGIPDDDALLATMSGLGTSGWLEMALGLRLVFKPHPVRPGYLRLLRVENN